MRWIFSSSRIRCVCVCSRPAVSTISMSNPRALARLAGIMGHGGGVAALLVLDDLAADALAPDGQLLHGGGAEGVARRHHHFLAVLLTAMGQFGDRRRLPRTVHPRHHHDRRPRRRIRQPAGVGQLLLQPLLDERLHVAGNLFIEEGLANLSDDLAGGQRTDVRQQQPFLQRRQEVLVHLAAQAKQRGNVGEDVAGGASGLL